MFSKFIAFFLITLSSSVFQTDADNKFLESVHLVAEVSNTNPKKGEAITVVYKLYVSHDVGISGWEELKEPTYAKFDSENIEFETVKVENDNYKGKPYRYVIFRKTNLIPTDVGSLQIEPLQLKVTADLPSKEKNDFGMSVLKSYTKTLQTNTVTINVKS
ncbi:BatD family protein [Meridianimaribacter flavus]|uniref:Oxygen tolerance protein BatD n=1 Tax=Meridianimaribacter flavus TaxID=571115 RepID=A0ABY2G3Z7_9FLAO|nr:BatD family protein [Meridianimaribacter flavus]TDY10521.1 oxygen tolerance protein BatD [Meridianimaribacter flavus]